MAIYNLAFIVVLIAVAEGFNQNWGFQMRQPRMPFAPLLPFPPFPVMKPFAPFKPFPPSAIKVPSTEEMANYKPGPNQYYTGISVQSSSNIVRGKDGKIIKTGGSTVVTNDNGEVTVNQVGNNPPKVNTIISPPTWQ